MSIYCSTTSRRVVVRYVLFGIWFVAGCVLSLANLQGFVGNLAYIILTGGLIVYAIEKTFPSQLKLNAKVS